MRVRTRQRCAAAHARTLGDAEPRGVRIATRRARLARCANAPSSTRPSPRHKARPPTGSESETRRLRLGIHRLSYNGRVGASRIAFGPARTRPGPANPGRAGSGLARIPSRPGEWVVRLGPSARTRPASELYPSCRSARAGRGAPRADGSCTLKLAASPGGPRAGRTPHRAQSVAGPPHSIRSESNSSA